MSLASQREPLPTGSGRGAHLHLPKTPPLVRHGQPVRMDVELASCAHRRAKVVRFAPRTWGHGGMSGASKGAWLHGMFELWFEGSAHLSG